MFHSDQLPHGYCGLKRSWGCHTHQRTSARSENTHHCLQGLPSSNAQYQLRVYASVCLETFYLEPSLHSSFFHWPSALPKRELPSRGGPGHWVLRLHRLVVQLDEHCSNLTPPEAVFHAGHRANHVRAGWLLHVKPLNRGFVWGRPKCFPDSVPWQRRRADHYDLYPDASNRTTWRLLLLKPSLQ